MASPFGSIGPGNVLGKELADLAEEHFKHDLYQSDRDALRKAATTAGTHVTVGLLTGLTLGALLARRSRAQRFRLIQAFQHGERPTTIKFASGREEPMPNITPLLRPSTAGGVLTYLFYGFLGTFFGGQIGGLTGGLHAKSQIAADRDSRERIATAMRRFRADALRAQAKLLDNQDSGSGYL